MAVNNDISKLIDNTSLLKDINKNLDKITENLSKVEENSKKEQSSTRDNSDLYEEEIKSLKKEAELVGGINDAFKDLKKTINLKNEALEQENKLLGQEADKLQGCVSQFTAMRTQIREANKGLDDANKKTKNLKEESKKVTEGPDLLEKGFGKLFGIFIKGVDIAIDKWREINQETYQYGRTLGMMSQRELRGFNRMVLNESVPLMMKYGASLKQLKELQEGFSESTGRSNILTKQQMGALLATSKFVGKDTALGVVDAVNKMGGSVMTSQEYLASTMERAKASGLNMAKTSKNFADNIKLASLYNFKNGIADVAKMTTLSDRLHVNLASLAGISDKFSNVEDAISTAAQLQVMGGSFGANFSNPLELMNMSLTDNAALIERFKDTIKGMGTFDEESGVVSVNSFNRARLKEIANSLGISFEDMMNSVNAEGKGQAVLRQAQGNLGETQKEWLQNNAEFDPNTKKWYVTRVDAQGRQVRKDVSEMDNKAIDLFSQTHTTEQGIASDVHSIRAYLLGETEKSADLKTSSSHEIINTSKESGAIILASAINPIMEHTNDIAITLLPKIIDILLNIGQWINGKLSSLVDWLGNHETIGKWIGGAIGLAVLTHIAKPGFISGGARKATSWTYRKIKGRFKGGEGTAPSSKPSGGASPNNGGTSSTQGTSKGGTSSTQGTSRGGTNTPNPNNPQNPNNPNPNNPQNPNNPRPSRWQSIRNRVSSSRVGRTVSNATSRASRATTKLGIKMFGKNGVRALGKAGKVLGPAAIALELGLAGYDIYDRNNQYDEEVNAINSRYGNFEKTNLNNRLRNGGASFYKEADKQMALSRADLERSNDNRATAFGAVGSTIGAATAFIPGVGVPLSMVLTPVLGWLGNKIARATEDKVTDEEVIGKKNLAQRNFEDTKLGLGNIKNGKDLQQQAAIATIGVHDLLISWHNEYNHKSREGLSEDEVKAKKKKLEDAKEKQADAREMAQVRKDIKKGGWTGFWARLTHPSTWSTGGIVYADKGTYAKGTDTVPAMLTPGEIVLNAKEQQVIRALIKKRDNNNSNPFNNSPFGRNNDININMNGTIVLKGDNVGYIDANKFKKPMIFALQEALDKYSNSRFNGGTVELAHSPNKLVKV